MEQKVILSVVTVTYRPDLAELKLFIDSFYRYNDLGRDACLIIVDNSPLGSWDTSAITTEYPDVAFISNPSNPGFGTSNNLGFGYCQSEYVLFVNNDVEFLEPVLGKIIKEFEKDLTIGCIGIHQEGGSPSFFKNMLAPKRCKVDQFDEKIHFISGAFMFFRSNIFIKIGKFDEKIFMYLEEFDLSYRLIQAGYHIKYMPHLSFLHKTGDRRIASMQGWIAGTEAYCHICLKYGFKLKKYFSQKRLWLLIGYNLTRFNLHEAYSIYKIIIIRKKILNKYYLIQNRSL